MTWSHASQTVSLEVICGTLCPVDTHVCRRQHVWDEQWILYWVIGTRATLKSLVWPCGTMAAFSGLFAWNARQTEGQYKIYILLVKVLGCEILVSAIITVSVLVGKLLSTGYYQATHINKMQAVILREYCLVLMLAINSLKKTSIDAWTDAVGEEAGPGEARGPQEKT